MKRKGRRPTLDRPATYQIKVPGHLDDHLADWVGKLTLMVEDEGDGTPITTLTGVVDQAALHGLLRRLYALGLPLISVNLIEADSEDAEQCPEESAEDDQAEKG
jgi:hypothetical protein